MSELFLTVINMSLTASYVILFVILVRLALKKAPKVISYVLWSVVAFRLIIPFSFESMFSLIPRNTSQVPSSQEMIYQQSPQMYSGIEVIDSFVSGLLTSQTIEASVKPLQIYEEIGVYIWILGIIALLVYSNVSVLILKRQLKSAQFIEKNIYEAKNLKTPFVLGLIRPKIYLPVGLSATERSYVLLHEQTHIKRTDHIIKVLSFLTLSVHWFNPLVWIAFLLMNMDMELSCDERVLKEMDGETKKSYASSLLALATGKHIMNGSPLTFGEGNVKARIKNVLNYKRPRIWVLAIAMIAVIAVGIGLISNPIEKSERIEADLQVQEADLEPIHTAIGEVSTRMRQDTDYQDMEDKFEDSDKLPDENDFDVEKNLEIIMSSPKTSSNPYDYINAHKKEYESFFEYGGEDALQYMQTQIEIGKADGLRGYIMMILCKELLDTQNNVTDDSLYK